MLEFTVHIIYDLNIFIQYLKERIYLSIQISFYLPVYNDPHFARVIRFKIIFNNFSLVFMKIFDSSKNKSHYFNFLHSVLNEQTAKAIPLRQRNHTFLKVEKDGQNELQIIVPLYNKRFFPSNKSLQNLTDLSAQKQKLSSLQLNTYMPLDN